MFRKWLGRDPAEALAETLDEASVPGFPVVHNEVLRLLRNPLASLDEIGVACAKDPALSVRILKSVNCANGSKRPVKNLAHAVSLLGRGELESLVLALAVQAMSPKGPVFGYDHQAFWRASARRAAVARNLARLLSPRDAMASFTAGLLQDMAVPILASQKGKPYGELLEHWRHEGGSLDDMERKEFGWDHARVGGLLSIKWSFPEVLQDAIGGHHEHAELAPVRLVALMDEGESSNVDAVVACATEDYGAEADQVTEAIALGVEDGDAFASSLTG